MHVGLYIVAAYWFTASTSFANPAVTLARTLTDTFAGIRPLDAPGFIGAQLVGAALASVNFLQRWSWIPRREACGTPCQSCRHRCEYQAIAPTGAVNYSECFQCLDCVSIYQDDKRCLPLIQERKMSRTVVPILPIHTEGVA
jgi:hypothetical protein